MIEARSWRPPTPQQSARHHLGWCCWRSLNSGCSIVGSLDWLGGRPAHWSLDRNRQTQGHAISLLNKPDDGALLTPLAGNFDPERTNVRHLRPLSEISRRRIPGEPAVTASNQRPRSKSHAISRSQLTFRTSRSQQRLGGFKDKELATHYRD
jgi:hypothetical protein